MTNNVQTDATVAEREAGEEIFVPLNKLKKSPKNARKKPHSEAFIESMAASLQFRGLINNLLIEPETKGDKPTGAYLVTAGEARRLAYLLRAKRKQIRKNHPVRCRLDTVNDPAEASLDENVTRENMHPADQFERFHELSQDKGWGAEEIGARFGVSPDVVRRRLKLGGVSPKLIDVYRQDGITLEQLMAFTLTDDHARQVQVFENLSYNKEPWIIRRDVTAGNVPATDRRAVFIGADAYEEAGGNVIRDLFTPDSGGYFEDAGLLDTLVVERLREIAADVLAEGWKWAEASISFPHDNGHRRYYPQTVALSDEDETRLSEAAAEHDALIEGYDSEDELPEEVAAKVAALDAEIDAISAKRSAFDPAIIERGGVFVSLNSEGRVRIERGFVRAEDEPQPEPEPEDVESAAPEADAPVGDAEDADTEQEADDADFGPDASNSVLRDLTAHRTLGLRLALGEQPDVAMMALTHAMVSSLFYDGSGQSCLAIGARSEPLGNHAAGIGDTKASETLDARHDEWGAQLPSDAGDLWPFIAGLDSDSRTALLAHCVSLTVNAVWLPWGRTNDHIGAADDLARAVDLDMTAYWTATKDAFFGRLSKSRIVQAVSEAVSHAEAERILPMKRADMAEEAERLVAGTGWLPVPLRTPEPEAQADEAAQPEAVETGEQPSEAEAPDTEAQDGVAGAGDDVAAGVDPATEEEDAYSVAAE